MDVRVKTRNLGVAHSQFDFSFIRKSGLKEEWKEKESFGRYMEVLMICGRKISNEILGESRGIGLKDKESW
ncbi:hypothetical protein Lal_00028550 [Lupinus albus]|nr:hypothetical protein Lal_00028550 [Lupinus albus]